MPRAFSFASHYRSPLQHFSVWLAFQLYCPGVSPLNSPAPELPLQRILSVRVHLGSTIFRGVCRVGDLPAASCHFTVPFMHNTALFFMTYALRGRKPEPDDSDIKLACVTNALPFCGRAYAWGSHRHCGHAILLHLRSSAFALPCLPLPHCLPQHTPAARAPPPRAATTTTTTCRCTRLPYTRYHRLHYLPPHLPLPARCLPPCTPRRLPCTHAPAHAPTHTRHPPRYIPPPPPPVCPLLPLPLLPHLQPHRTCYTHACLPCLPAYLLPSCRGRERVLYTTAPHLPCACRLCLSTYLNDGMVRAVTVILRASASSLSGG